MANNSDFTALGGLDRLLKSLDTLGDKTRKAEKEAARLTQQFSGLQNGLASSSGTGGFVDDLNAGLQTAKEEMTDFAEISGKVAAGIGTAFEDAFEKLLLSGKDFKTVLQRLEADLIRLGTRTLTSTASQSLGGAGGLLYELGGALFGGGGSLASLFPGFSTGGQFTVGGAAGVDQNLVPLRLTRGERVTIETPAQQRLANNATAAPVINMAFNISTPDAASFRLSQTQIQGEALRQAQRSLRRNG
ncbi:hypothetical protein J0X12_13190 [Sneathiella sp. CAU 1612]|uniref:Phage tail tape measure protein n=1 Tax=Sneathiella sedimenti TaxID=2816034 RepID=A0ABS3F8C0_9PROT|nr:hypothetical protein [Sneathiella sedimenti]MBO0334577.1 hypothetical protein [Sneathiella sedimenti]